MSSSSANPNLIQNYNSKKNQYYDYNEYTRNSKIKLTEQYIINKSIRQKGQQPPTLASIQLIQPYGQLLNNNFTQGTNSPLD